MKETNMLSRILTESRAILAEITDDRIAALETACRDAERARAATAGMPTTTETERARSEAQRANDVLSREQTRRNDALLTLKRYAPLENPQPPKGAAAAYKPSLMGESTPNMGAVKKSLVEAISADEIATFGTEEVAARLVEAEGALKVAQEQAAEAREALIQFEFDRASSGYLATYEALLPLAASVRAASQLLERGTPDGIIDGNAYGLTFGMSEMVAAARAELLGASPE
ncbi:MAG: hypothetical protein NTX56_06965 [Proteobacteria bacterium]|nr:hypothetical protein [Pseudomonadota bacterium]